MILASEKKLRTRFCEALEFLVLAFASVVTGAGLDFVVLLVLDFQLAIRAVLLRVRGNVPDVVLAPELGRDLVERLF